MLKQQLIQPPVLQYPQFHSAASQFVVYTDASEVGLGAVYKKNVWLLYMPQSNSDITY